MTPRPIKASLLRIRGHWTCSWLVSGSCRFAPSHRSRRVERRARRLRRGTHLVRRGAARMIAAGHRAFEREHRINVLVDERGELAQVGERERGQIAALGLGVAHRPGDGLVRVAERHALAHQIVGEVGRRGEALAWPRRACAQAPASSPVATRSVMIARLSRDRVDGVEQRLLVFLVVLVVGQRLRLHQHQQRRDDRRSRARSCRAPAPARPDSSSAA